MSKIKIYDGVVIDMGTSEVLELGESRYVDSSEVAHCGGGLAGLDGGYNLPDGGFTGGAGNFGGSTGGTNFTTDIANNTGGGATTGGVGFDNDSTFFDGSDLGKTRTTSGYANPYKDKIDAAINAGQNLYDKGELGAVAGFTDTQLAGQTGGVAAANRQTILEKAMADQANLGTDLSGMRQGALIDAQNALGLNAANAGMTGGLGGSRQRINQGSLANDLAAKFGEIDLTKQKMDFANKGTALAAQGTGAETLAGIGLGQQQQAQNVLDSKYAGLSQLSNVFGGFMPKQTDVASQQGGGK